MNSLLLFSFVAVIVIGRGAYAAPPDCDDIPTLKFMNVLATYKGMDWMWTNDFEVCLISRPGVPYPLMCLKVPKEESERADYCD